MEKIRLETERLVLTEWGKSQKEVDFLVKNFNNKNLIKTLLSPPYPYTKEDALKFLSSRNEAKEKGNYCFKILKKDNKKILGNISLDYRGHMGSAEVGYYICEEEWNNGYATEALRTIIGFGFNIGIHKIFAKHYKDNPASGCVMKKCGMVQEGVQKEQILKDGIYHDNVLLGIINKKGK